PPSPTHLPSTTLCRSSTQPTGNRRRTSRRPRPTGPNHHPADHCAAPLGVCPVYFHGVIQSAGPFHAGRRHVRSTTYHRLWAAHLDRKSTPLNSSHVSP